MSPASGDINNYLLETHSQGLYVSIQLMSPASGDASSLAISMGYPGQVSIQLMSPASGDSSYASNYK